MEEGETLGHWKGIVTSRLRGPWQPQHNSYFLKENNNKIIINKEKREERRKGKERKEKKRKEKKRKEKKRKEKKRKEKERKGGKSHFPYLFNIFSFYSFKRHNREKMMIRSKEEKIRNTKY